MTRDDIIRMAMEAGFVVDEAGFIAAPKTGRVGFQLELERFAALVEQNLIANGYRQCAVGQRTSQFCGQLEAAIAAEREACAKVCDERYMGDNNREDMEAKRCAKAIRARGDK